MKTLVLISAVLNDEDKEVTRRRCRSWPPKDVGRMDEIHRCSITATTGDEIRF